MKYSAKLAFLVISGIGVIAAQGPPPGYFGGPRGGFGHGGPREQVVKGLPYSGVMMTERQQTADDGTQTSRQMETKVYRDNEGRIRRETTRTSRSGRSETFIELFDPVAGFQARLDPQKLTAFKHTLPTNSSSSGDEQGANRRFEGGTNAKTEDLGSKTINGLVATGKRMTITIPAGDTGEDEGGQMVREVWTSTALKVPVSMKMSNPRFGKSTTELKDVSQAESDASLFQIPANYKVSTKGPHTRPGQPE